MILYGKRWPDDTPKATVHLWCYRHWDPEQGMLPRHKHFELAIKALWPETLPNGERGYIWSSWSHRRLWSWVYNEYQTWWGPAASAKSTDGAVFALTEWLAAPDRTTVTLCSTSIEALRQRIWREVVRFHSLLKIQDPDILGSFRRQPPMLSYEPEGSESSASTINAIFGIAMPEGSDDDAMRNAFGKHNDYNILILDELQMMHPAAANAYDNLSTGGLGSKFLGMGNPVSRLDGLGKASEPKNGWNSISPSMDQWETKRGVCLYFDGLKSPALEDPERYFFLINQADIDQMAEDPGRDSPRFWSQRRGFVPPEGLTQTVFTENFIEKFHVKDKAVWVSEKILKMAFDPAFSAGGDRAVLTPFHYGRFTNGMMGIEFEEPITINLELSSGEPLTYNLAFKVIKHLESRGLDPSDLSMDCTGQGNSVADVIDREWAMKHKDESSKKKVYRVLFNSAASSEPVSVEDETPCKDKYKNKVTELWYVAREFARYDQLRGLCEIAITQFCSREVLMAGKQDVIESKTDMKSRTGGRSPDHADSVVVGLEYVRFKLGGTPGKGDLNTKQTITLEDVQKADIETTELYEDDIFAFPDLRRAA